MQKGKGFFRLVLAISILVFLIMSVYTFYELETGYYSSKSYWAGLKGDSPIGKHIILGMVGGALSVIPVWIIYGLTIFVVKGFKGQKKGRGFLRLVVALSISVFLLFFLTAFFNFQGRFIEDAMIVGALSVIPVWIIYGLTIFVIKGFMKQKE
ncbi:hypothetical protein KAU34_00310 [candidate division WOR-3 bacterium]|nr:hypothetical protein [candidate division WOR-3 bacterium]